MSSSARRLAPCLGVCRGNGSLSALAQWPAGKTPYALDASRPGRLNRPLTHRKARPPPAASRAASCAGCPISTRGSPGSEPGAIDDSSKGGNWRTAHPGFPSMLRGERVPGTCGQAASARPRRRRGARQRAAACARTAGAFFITPSKSPPSGRGRKRRQNHVLQAHVLCPRYRRVRGRRFPDQQGRAHLGHASGKLVPLGVGPRCAGTPVERLKVETIGAGETLIARMRGKDPFARQGRADLSRSPVQLI